MIKIIKTIDGQIKTLENAEPGCWIQVQSPTPEDLAFLETCGVQKAYLRYATDEEELSRIEVDNDQILLVVDVPTAAENARTEAASTLPISFIIVNGMLISVASDGFAIFDEISISSKLNTVNHLRTILQFLGKTAIKYMQVLKEVDHIVTEIEHRAVKSLGKNELLELMEVQKSLVYITSSLQSDLATIERIKLGTALRIEKADAALLDDILIEVRQAYQVASIHASILNETLDNYGSIVSNNLNDVMKILTSATLLLSVPMVIFGLYGMNVQGLWFPQSPWFAIAVSLVIMVLLGVWLVRKKML